MLRSLVTLESVFSEVLFLLRDMPRSRSDFLAFCSEGVAFGAEANRAALTALLRKYADAVISMADAAVVRLLELHPGALVWSLDKDSRI
jgi:hypothetical protein